MKTINIRDVAEEEQKSPAGKYRSFCKNISLALGGTRDTGTWNGGHPFDLQIRRVPPGAAVCPLHAHAVQWELFVVISGTATVRVDASDHHVATGDTFVQPPGVAHQITNTGPEDFIFYVIADNPPADSTWYPNSKKWMLKPGRKIFHADSEIGYFVGEE